jgi:RNA polymerase sigma-70 factor, ECF subfamily
MHAEIILRVLGGERDAYAQIVRQYQSMLTAYAAFRIPDRNLIDEVVQQTFIRAFEQLQEYQADKDFGVWLRTICKFVMLAEIKRSTEERRKAGNYKDYLRARLLESSTQDWEVQPVDAAMDLKHCLEQLQPRARQLIEYRYLQQMSVDQVAVAFEQSAEWAATTLFRVRATLRKCMDSKIQIEVAQ